MMRQVALGAVVAFAATVLLLSVCQPTADVTPAPVLQPVAAPQTAPVNPATPVVGTVMPVKPLMLRPTNAIRPELLQQPQAQPVAVDAGAQ